MADEKSKLEPVVVLGECEHGKTILRRGEDGQVNLYESIPWESGKTIPPGAELVRYHKRIGDAQAMEVLHKSGPSQVSTEKYRDGWDRIFGGKPNKEIN